MSACHYKPLVSLSSKSGATQFSFRLSRKAVRNGLIAVAVLAGLIAGVPWLVRTLWGTADGRVGSVYALPAGPWGELTAQPVLIEAPASRLSPNYRLGDGRWYFRAAQAGEVQRQLLADGLSAPDVASLMPTVQEVEDRPGLWAARPSAELVLGMHPEVRTALYEKLSAIPENLPQHEPFRMTDAYLDHWLEPGEVPPEIIAQVKSLLWRRGNALLFSDYNVVADGLSSPTVKMALLKQLTRKASLVVRLKVPGQGDVTPLAQFWGFGGRVDKVSPLLHSLAQSGGGELDVANLLPPFARQRLYRFPDPLPDSDLGPGCHWSAFNFFNTGPADESLHTPEGVEQVLRGSYTPATGEPRFGDIILLTLPDGSSIHSAVYIADGIVFTKNGPSLATPFLFSTMEDMLAFYPSSERLTLNYYRRVGT